VYVCMCGKVAVHTPRLLNMPKDMSGGHEI